jgi:deoxyribodipyrimidine photo-lyase
MMAAPPNIVWFRQDLRLADNPALTAAAAASAPVLGVYVLDDETPGRWRLGGASRWWLHHSLSALSRALEAHGVPLLIRRGRSAPALAQLAAETRAAAVFWNGHLEPHWRQAEREVEEALTTQGIAGRAFGLPLLFDPARVAGRSGCAFKVFTPFWRACLAAAPPAAPLPPPESLHGCVGFAAGSTLADLRLLPTKPDWASGLREVWSPGETEAHAQLAAFLDQDLAGYAALRDRPEPGATSQLSPALHFGELSARQVWHATAMRMALEPQLAADGHAFLRELGWREFYARVLFAHPDVAEVPMQARFADFPWASAPAGLKAWQQGRTGFPIVDAGMRQLWQTGWMHNRVRMIVASFLTKDLLIPWQDGEAWFWDTLVDADMANNAGGWQWVAGCGTDAAPFFRVFSPVRQGENFDPQGNYVRRWVPELARLPARWIHRPWDAPPLESRAAGVRLGASYPTPILDHESARKRALAAFASLQRPQAPK